MKLRSLMLASAVALAAFGSLGSASAHECPQDGPPPDENACRDTEPVDNWRGSYLPVFEPVGRDDPSVRYHLQRWHDECDNQQQCTWVENGFSVMPNGDEEIPSPNEIHVGTAATHCFLGEAAHDCSDHKRGASSSDPVHDSHGGAIFIDLCLAPNPDTSHGNGLCQNGIEDTTIGLIIVDHNPCGTFVPIVACTDEYHVWKPFDQAYTEEQMAMTQAHIEDFLADPETWVVNWFCGNPQYSQNCFLRD